MKSVEKELGCSLVPFLKWPGGKRWFVCRYADLLPKKYGTYIEPFLGAGSVFFHAQPRRALLGDANPELINAYKVIRDDWVSLQDTLEHHQICHEEDAEGYYYWVRKNIPEEPFLRAARLIYLNRTCFNGIYRVNRQGLFNVPKGSKDKVIIETDNFRGMSSLLAGSELVSGDFEPLIERAVRNDFVFCDPPYTVRHNYNGFVKYNEVLFSWADQERLAAALLRAAKRGVKIVCTNANHQSVRELYSSKKFKQIVVSRRSPISADSAGRRSYEELIVQANI